MRNKKIIFNSPVLEFIATKIIQPLLNYCPPSIPRSAFLWDEVFHLDERRIDEYVVKQGRVFQMPGLYRITSLQALKWYGPREVRSRYRLWVRRDSTRPDQVEVEVEDPKNFKLNTPVFLLTEGQFKSIRRHLVKLKRPGKDLGGAEV